jgi:predicted nucleotidyltransferase
MALMTRDQVIAKLREHEIELKSAGILRLAVFGSVARGDASPVSDVDLIGEFDREKHLTLFDMAGLEIRLGEIVGTRVDLADRKLLKHSIKLRAEREAILAF